MDCVQFLALYLWKNVKKESRDNFEASIKDDSGVGMQAIRRKLERTKYEWFRKKEIKTWGHYRRFQKATINKKVNSYVLPFHTGQKMK